MDYVGIDLHKRESQICLLTDAGEVIEHSVPTRRDRLVAALGGRAPARILLEASTESEWVAQCLEAAGHTVIVADPNYAPMYPSRRRRVKTNRRDAQALAEACRLGTYRPAHRVSASQRAVRQELTVRELFVRTRTRAIALTRALVRQEGLRVPSCGAEQFRARLGELTVSPALQTRLAAVVALLTTVDAEIARADAGIAAGARADPAVTRLMTVPGVGPVTATAFVATLDRVDRFASPSQVASYLGLVPSEASSADYRRRGHITKAGDGRLRWLLVQVAWSLRRSRGRAARALRDWAQRIERRRGVKVAMVALARRLAGILFALWRDETVFEACRLGASRRPAA